MSAVRVAGLVPHAGMMCLLDEVVAWADDCIHCRSRLPAPTAHPLADRGVMPVTALIEYAAQATAAHGTLRARAADGMGPAAGGRLVGLRHIELLADAEAVAGLASIDIHAERLMADASGSIYAFRVVAGVRDLVRGRLTIRTVAAD
ncbi:phosphotransferase [Salinisphaera sp. LB1]|uniref:phosphotransferase n=1 Tax=Salinisphaera sp. LB1 TaxID=2183911 RepID=UPI0011AB5B78|nr:phosphotransferase [Salinisphaera sp. LB1]